MRTNGRTDPEEAPIANPGDAESATNLYRMWAGEGSPTIAYVWANSFDTAFEEFVEWLDDNAPGLLANVTEEDLREAAADAGILWQDHWPDFGDEDFERVAEIAEMDLTIIGHTTLKNGQYIPSYAWGGQEVDPKSMEWQVIRERSLKDGEDDEDEDDGEYVVQGILGDRVLYEYAMGNEAAAIREAKALHKSLDFEGDQVRVIVDGELVLEIGHEDMEPNSRWSTAYKNQLPDSAFLFVRSDCVEHRDNKGRSHPLSCRELPVKNKGGNWDKAHLRSAIGRAAQLKGVSATTKRRLQDKARRIYDREFGS